MTGMGGLAPQILVGFFFKGPPKKILTEKKKKNHSKGESEVQTAVQKKKKGS
jgi:hypothetical protein